MAESTSPVRGYARGILGLLKDRRFYPDELDFGGERSMPTTPGNVAQSITLRVFPVPASTTLSVSWPPLPAESEARLLVYDIYGQQWVREQIAPFENQRTLETAHLPVGVYFLVVSDKGKTLHQIKFSIQR